MEERVRVAAYCRVSTDKEDQIHSLEAQRAFFAEYIQRRPGWTLAGLFADEGLSGTSASRRPEFTRMIQLAGAGQIDLIVTKEVSRFARNTVDTLTVTRALKASGVGVLFLNDNIDTRENDGEFRLTIMASVAQEESRKISERTRWGQAQAMRRGVVFGNNSIYGYTLSGGRLAVEPAQAEVVKAIYYKFLAERKGTYVIARELTEEGIAPPLGSGRAWSSTAVLRILRNEKYTGDLLQQKYRTIDYLSHKKVKNDGTQPQLLLQDHHAAIISRGIFDQAQAELARRRDLSRGGRRFSARYWYSGRIVCGGCGRSFTAKRSRGRKGQEYLRFVCRGRTQAGGTACDMRSLSGTALRLCTGEVLRQLALDREGIVNQLMREVGRPREEPLTEGAAGQELRRRLQRQIARRQRALEAYLDGAISEEDWRRQTEQCDEAIKELRQLGQEQRPRRAAPPETSTQETIRAMLERELTGGPWVLEEVIRQVVVFQDHLMVYVQEAPLCFRVRIEGEGSGRGYRTALRECTAIPLAVDTV